MLGQPSEVYSEETAVTSSGLEIILSTDVNMKRLSCLAENTFIDQVYPRAQHQVQADGEARVGHQH